MFVNLGNANRLQADEAHHVVEHAHADGNSIARDGAPCQPAVTRGCLEAIRCIFREQTPIVAAVFLPFATAKAPDHINRVVTPRLARSLREPLNIALARRNRGRSVARSDRGMARFGIVGLVTVDDIERFVVGDLVEQFGQDVKIGYIPMPRQHCTHLTSICVEHEMHFAPQAALYIAKLAHLQFALAAELHARAVDRQMDRPNNMNLYLKGLPSATQCRIVRHGQGSETRSCRLSAKPCSVRSGKWNLVLMLGSSWSSRSLYRRGRPRSGISPRATSSIYIVTLPRLIRLALLAGQFLKLVACFRLVRLAFVVTRLFKIKNQESTLEPEPLARGTQPVSCCAQMSSGLSCFKLMQQRLSGQQPF